MCCINKVLQYFGYSKCVILYHAGILHKHNWYCAELMLSVLHPQYCMSGTLMFGTSKYLVYNLDEYV